MIFCLNSKSVNYTGHNHRIEVSYYENKGRGVKAIEDIPKGKFVIDYGGSFLDSNEAKAREAQYSKRRNNCCYMYYIYFKGKKFCWDATDESNHPGRLINHSKKNANLIPKIIEIQGTPRVLFFAKFNIKAGSEILYNYNDSSKSSVKYNPWLLT